jgi:hypothetical protein
MPLTPPQPRERLHTRAITIEGFRRADGLFDIEAELADTKTYGFENEDRGVIGPGERLHGMFMRMTVDEDLTIVACEAAMDDTPYGICPTAAPSFARLAGLRIKPGFLRDAFARVAGINGCTHLRELLQQMATVAYQTLYPIRQARGEASDSKPALLNTCRAYAPDSPVVARRWPHLAQPAQGD